MTLAQARREFVAACSLVQCGRNRAIASLYQPACGLVVAAYATRAGLLRHRDDLVAEGVLGLVEGVRRGVTGDELAQYVLDHVERWRLRFSLKPLSPEGVARHASAAETAEETMVRKEEPEVQAVSLARRMRDLRPAIARLPEKDRELVHAYYKRGRTVRQLGAELGISGMAVSYRLRRIRDRLRVLVDMPELTADGIRRDLGDVVSSQRIEGYKPVEALVLYYETFSQSETAERLGVAQERVSYTVTQAVRRLETIHKLAKYHRAFSLIQRHGQMWSRR